MKKTHRARLARDDGEEGKVQVYVCRFSFILVGNDDKLETVRLTARVSQWFKTLTKLKTSSRIVSM